MDNIDDCYVDKDESEDTSPVTDHWAKQLEVLTKHAIRRGRFLRVRKFNSVKIKNKKTSRKLSCSSYLLQYL